MKWTFASDAADQAQERDVDVDRAVAKIYAARARRNAVELNRRRDYEGAANVLRETARRVRSYAAGDAVLLRIAKSLERDADRYTKPLDSMQLKRGQFDAKNVLGDRDPLGKARRGAGGDERYPLETASGHPIAVINGVHALIDTGSPLSFGRPFTLLGKDHRPQPGFGPIDVTRISQLIGARVDVLLGTDILANQSLLLDWRDGAQRSHAMRSSLTAGGSMRLFVWEFHASSSR
jgi:hypothetical protein